MFLTKFLNKRLTLILFITLCLELVFNFLIIQKVPYTEIDHVAYMQEVDGFMKGDWDYANLRGDTGPLVYPAGFLYIFTVLRVLLSNGNIRQFQYFFMLLYVAFIGVVLGIYRRATKDSKSLRETLPLMIVMLCASRRIHSIFVLRLFNDCVAMFFLYCATLIFTYDYWMLGCLVFSFALSVKMNILLFLPGLLVLLTKRFGVWKMPMYVTGIALVQVVLALPFLYTEPHSYMKGAFDFGRKFFFKWTVNFKFLPEEVFLSDEFHKLLLAATALTLIVFGFKWTRMDGGPLKTIFRGAPVSFKTHKIAPEHIVWILFTSNFVGIVFSRSLHFQFYVWYYHTLPFLLFYTSSLSTVERLLLWAVNELVWNIFPAQAWTSILLQVIHLRLLYGLLMAPAKVSYREKKSIREKGNKES
uniref:dolichyl-P-Man:Man5GlcNAc2-PP-dolichol alpha-1,3-mannosyltransferase n=1 Tax=Percolomonas cosmopolitus TaxID=63605 RepID=A0A7S1KNQ2_9EUKA|mmetsp:Transcript_3189/g.12214  ORF Transcript_3189/g.12214 Transcript_3189/m.12214 type:complete len:415 (+) Transcript_3189:23-1267(+)